MSGQVYEQLTLFQEDFPASHFPWLESKKAKGTTVICGRKCSELSESLRRVGSSVRTYLESCVLPLPTLYRTWSVKDMTSRCLILRLRLSVLRTEEKESSLWPTVTTDSATNRKTKYKQGGTPLTVAVGMYPTPTQFDATCGDLKGKDYTGENRHSMKLIQAAKMYPTPTAQDFKHRGPNSRQQGLPEMVRMWPTPCAMDTVTGRLKSSQQKPGSMHSVTLPDAVRMWPTPTTQETEHPEAELTETGRRKTADGNSSHSLGLADAVRLWPTPTMRDYKGSNSMEHMMRATGHKNHTEQLANAVKLWPTPITSDANPPAKGRPWLQLREAVLEEKLLPTPSAAISQGSTGGNRPSDLRTEARNIKMYSTPTTAMSGRSKRFSKSGAPNPQEVAKAEGGQLNPDWVEWLMGFPVGWTSLTSQG